VFATGKAVYSDLFAGQVSGSYLVGISAPVMRDGRVAYCVTIAVPAQAFQSLVEGQPRLPGAGAVLFDSRGFIIARAARAREFVGRLVPPETLAAAHRTQDSFDEGSSVEGKSFFRAVVRSDVTGWGAGVAVTDETTSGATWRSMREAGLAIALILGLAVFAALRIARLQTLQQASEAESRAKDELIAALSHELRNPFGAIELAAEAVQRTVGKDHRARGPAEAIVRQVAQLRRVLDDLLDTTRAIHGKLALEPQPVELRHSVEVLAADYRERPGMQASIAVEGDSAWVSADPARLNQMLDNLLQNAVKYGARRVTARIEARGAMASLRLIDDGQGIDPGLLGRLFEPFVQGAQTLDRAQGGLGLGLALVRRLAALHGGSVSAASEGPGRGSTFTLTLPVTQPPAHVAAPAAGPALRPQTILIVDDAEDARESLRMLLELEGHRVLVAADGPQGLVVLARELPDVALIDIGLPGMDGFEVARRARALPRGASLRLFAVTGYGQPEDRERALAAGFDLHIIKPFSYVELVQALDGIERRAA
jgi:signal transduction histidine kinase